MSIERAEADLVKVRGEIQKLNIQLEGARARVAKIENYLEMARLYDAPETEEQNKSRSHNGSPLVPVCINIIRQRGKRQPTRVLVHDLEQLGFVIGGSNKITNLSGALSRSSELVANRAEGWGLAEWGTANNPDDERSVDDVTSDAILKDVIEDIKNITARIESNGHQSDHSYSDPFSSYSLQSDIEKLRRLKDEFPGLSVWEE